MSKTVRNILIVFAGIFIVIAVLCFYLYLPLDGLQYSAGQYSSGTEDEASFSALEGSAEDGISDSDEDPIDEFEYKLKDITLMVNHGDVATVRIQGKPYTTYSIEVWYSSGPSSAKGLDDKISNAEGYVEWSWTISSNVDPGIYQIYIKDNGKTVIRTWIQVME